MAITNKHELTRVVSMSNSIFTSEYYTLPEMELNLQQKRLLTYLIARINRDDTEFRLEQLSISDYCALLGINYQGGATKKNVRNSLLALGGKCFLRRLPDGSKKVTHWVDTLIISPDNTVISIKLAEELRIYYLGLKEKFTAYQLGYAMRFTSKYSYSLYEFCKSNEFKQFFCYDVAAAKRDWGYGKYEVFTDFKRNVLDPAIKEINDFSDINVQCRVKKEGKSYKTLCFYVERKRGKELAAVDTWKIEAASTAKDNAMLNGFFHDEIYAAVMDDGSKDIAAEAEYQEAMTQFKNAAK